MLIYFTTFSTALEDFSVACAHDGTVRATAFGDSHQLRQRLKPAAGDSWQADNHSDGPTAQARQQIRAYLTGQSRHFTLPLFAEGTVFQKKVWSELQAIPRGETRSYGALARRLDTAARAIGRANALNPICLLIPCHRVIGAQGELTGFAFGAELKQRLLELEQAWPPTMV